MWCGWCLVDTLLLVMAGLWACFCAYVLFSVWLGTEDDDE